MRAYPFAVAILTLTLTAGPACAQEKPEPPVVVTTGEGVVKAAPDRARLSMATEGRARGPREAQQQSAVLMTAVQKSLQDSQIPKDAIRTTGYDLQQEYDYVNGKQISRGYVARNSIEVRVDDIARAGVVLDAAVAAGATSVGGIQFELKDRDKMEREALRLAVVDARARADAAVSGAGQTVDRVIKIEESRAMVAPPMPQYRMVAAMAESAPQTPVAAGEMEVRAQVTLTASIK